jgi:hypothetical protein
MPLVVNVSFFSMSQVTMSSRGFKTTVQRPTHQQTPSKDDGAGSSAEGSGSGDHVQHSSAYQSLLPGQPGYQY